MNTNKLVEIIGISDYNGVPISDPKHPSHHVYAWVMKYPDNYKYHISDPRHPLHSTYKEMVEDEEDEYVTLLDGRKIHQDDTHLYPQEMEAYYAEADKKFEEGRSAREDTYRQDPRNCETDFDGNFLLDSEGKRILKGGWAILGNTMNDYLTEITNRKGFLSVLIEIQQNKKNNLI